MTRRVRLACRIAFCGLMLLALHALCDDAVGDICGYGGCCNGRCVCAPNTREFGYSPPTWRTWPGEVRKDVVFPGSVDAQAIPTPQGEKQEPLPKETIPPSGLPPYPQQGPGEIILPPLEGMPGGNIFDPGRFNIEGAVPILPPDGDKSSIDSILPGGIIPGLPAETPQDSPGGIDSPLDFPEDSDTTPATPPTDEPAAEPSSEPAATPPGDRSQLPEMLPDLVAHNPVDGVSGIGQPANRQPLPAAPGQELKEPDAVPAHSKPVPAHMEPVLAEPQLLPPESPKRATPEGNRQPLPVTPGPSLAAPELSPGDATPQRRVAKSLQANWTAALHPGGRGDSGPGRSVYPSQPVVASRQELDIDEIGHEIPIAPDTHADDSPPLALDGFCPVELVGSESWKPGDPRWSTVYEGRTYLFSAEAQLRRFRAEPQRFAPALSGQDPVLLVDGNRRVPGRTDYCVTYKGRLYMFSGSVTLTRFRKAPSRYAGGLKK